MSIGGGHSSSSLQLLTTTETQERRGRSGEDAILLALVVNHNINIDSFLRWNAIP